MAVKKSSDGCRTKAADSRTFNISSARRKIIVAGYYPRKPGTTEYPMSAGITSYLHDLSAATTRSAELPSYSSNN